MVSKFQNEFMKSSFLPKYEQKIVRISALTTQGRNPDNFLFIFHKLILKFTDHYDYSKIMLDLCWIHPAAQSKAIWKCNVLDLCFSDVSKLNFVRKLSTYLCTSLGNGNVWQVAKNSVNWIVCAHCLRIFVRL